MTQEKRSRLLSEHDSKQLLASYGLGLCEERLVENAEAAAAAAAEIGFPVVLKLCGERIAHKTERGLVRLGLTDAEAVRRAAEDLLARARPEDHLQGLLVAEQVEGRRELITGLVRDPQFGPCVSLGLGGILTEALGDVVFASAPASHPWTSSAWSTCWWGSLGSASNVRTSRAST
jgi:acetyl-CoA synthetase (ADP-forming)